MKNLSYLIYKDYYQDFIHWGRLTSKEKRDKDQIERFFNKKNTDIIDNRFNPEILDGLLKNYESSIDSFELVLGGAGLLTGAGYNHEVGAAGEVKMGYSIDYTSGLPFIPGSSIKGVLKSAFPKIRFNRQILDFEYDIDKTESEYEALIFIENVKANFIMQLLCELGNKNFLKKDFILEDYEGEVDLKKLYEIKAELFEGVDFLNNSEVPSNLPICNRDIFCDAFPIKVASNGKLLALDAITKHSSITKNPIPIPFLTVIPEVVYKFMFDFKPGKHLNQEQKVKIVQKLLMINGVGAKTNVGYGVLTMPIKKNEDSELLRALKEPDKIDIKILPLLKKGKQFPGKVLQIAEGVAEIEMVVNNYKFNIYRKQSTLAATIVVNSEVIIQINADFDLRKLNCKISLRT